jgi:uncharacterized protein YlxW (UPF0749 family)
MAKNARKPALSTQLKAAQAETAALQKRIEQFERTSKYENDARAKAERELSDIHAFLDAVPNAPASKTTEYSQPISAMTRLSVYLATR